MNFKIDENLPIELGEELRSLGHGADTVEEEGLAGAADSTVVAAAHVEGRIVLTLDKGIADIVRFPSQTHSGIVLFRPGLLGRKAVLSYVRDRLPSSIGPGSESHGGNRRANPHAKLNPADTLRSE